MTVTDQARAFLAMALCGALLGAVCDALGALRRGRLLTAAADLLFGVLADPTTKGLADSDRAMQYDEPK